MSRRSGQVQTGCIQKDGNWYVVRYWQDVAGQGRRQRVREKICPLSGPGKLSASERQRKAKEIIAASGANSVEHRQSAHSVTFQEQAVTWLNQIKNRKRKPLAPSTVENWEGHLEKWINPNIGDMPLESVNNLAMKNLVANMVASEKLGPKSIVNYTQVVKMVVASAVSGEGEQLYPRGRKSTASCSPSAQLRACGLEKPWGFTSKTFPRTAQPSAFTAKRGSRNSTASSKQKTASGKWTCITRWRRCFGSTLVRGSLACCSPHGAANRSNNPTCSGARCIPSWPR